MAFWNKYPYLNINDLNLDYLLQKIKEVSEAKNVSFDDEVAALGTDNVQGAIDALKSIIDATNRVIVIDDIIPVATWTSGANLNHIQTVNNSMLMEIINAVRDDKWIIIKSFNGDDYDYYTCVGVDVDNVYFTHKLTFFNIETEIIRSLTINGINDETSVYVDISADTAYPIVHKWNDRDGDVNPEAGDYNAAQIDYNNAGSGLSATNAQDAIDEIDAKLDNSYISIGIRVFNSTADGIKTVSDLLEDVATQLQAYIAANPSLWYEYLSVNSEGRILGVTRPTMLNGYYGFDFSNLYINATDTIMSYAVVDAYNSELIVDTNGNKTVLSNSIATQNCYLEVELFKSI